MYSSDGKTRFLLAITLVSLQKSL